MGYLTVIDAIRLEWIPTARLANMALTWHAYSGNAYGWQYVWQGIGTDENDAHEFYASVTDQEELRSLALEALDRAGWSASAINFRLS